MLTQAGEGKLPRKRKKRGANDDDDDDEDAGKRRRRAAKAPGPRAKRGADAAAAAGAGGSAWDAALGGVDAAGAGEQGDGDGVDVVETAADRAFIDDDGVAAPVEEDDDIDPDRLPIEARACRHMCS